MESNSSVSLREEGKIVAFKPINIQNTHEHNGHYHSKKPVLTLRLLQKMQHPDMASGISNQVATDVTTVVRVLPGTRAEL